MIHAAGGTHWSSFWRELDADKIAEAQGLGLQVLAWTVNEPAAMERLLDMGVDGIVTDRPDMATAILERRGIRW
jgi:glycerophosphoryl diester phosphodiesterase